jgi:predicted glycoside hydrolase/deacetylase ChbG (UPF0249 family)
MIHPRNLVKWLIMVIPLLSIQNTASAQETIRLLVRGDDMGKSYGRTLGAIKAHRDGILTSASLMPTSAFFNESVRLCKENPDLATGIHITLVGTRQRPVLSPEEIPSLVTPKGIFYETSEQLKNANPSTGEMEKEIRAQIGKVRASGLNFVYLDWHRGVPDAARDIIYRICQDEKLIYGQDFDGSIYGYPRIKLVQESWPNVDLPDGQKVYYAAPELNQDKKESFFKALSAIEPGTWVTTVHPGLADPERTSVTELLCAPETREIIKAKNIQLISYRDLWEEEFGQPKKQER